MLRDQDQPKTNLKERRVEKPSQWQGGKDQKFSANQFRGRFIEDLGSITVVSRKRLRGAGQGGSKSKRFFKKEG